MTGAVSTLWHYPVKGLSGQPLETVTLTPGRGFPDDRIFAFARAGGAYDPAVWRPLKKTEFHMLARDAALANIRSHYGDGVLRLSAGEAEATFDLRTEDGKRGAEAFLARHLSLADAARPQFADAGENRFTDISVDSEAMMNAVSLISLSTVRALGQRLGVTLDPMRFRGNITFDGFGPQAELEWEGRELAVGEARLKVVHRTTRCAATTVNPATAERDVPIPRRLMELFGHAQLGVYAEVVAGGAVRPGDAVRLLPAA